jgi:hypothetical protein
MVRDDAKERAYLYRRLFSTPDGQALLEYLKTKALKSNFFTGEDGVQNALSAAWADGSNWFCREVILQIDRANMFDQNP